MSCFLLFVMSVPGSAVLTCLFSGHDYHVPPFGLLMFQGCRILNVLISCPWVEVTGNSWKFVDYCYDICRDTYRRVDEGMLAIAGEFLGIGFGSRTFSACLKFAMTN